jgi:hypothetical protein
MHLHRQPVKRAGTLPQQAGELPEIVRAQEQPKRRPQPAPEKSRLACLPAAPGGRIRVVCHILPRSFIKSVTLQCLLPLESGTAVHAHRQPIIGKGTPFFNVSETLTHPENDVNPLFAKYLKVRLLPYPISTPLLDCSGGLATAANRFQNSPITNWRQP